MGESLQYNAPTGSLCNWAPNHIPFKEFRSHVCVYLKPICWQDSSSFASSFWLLMEWWPKAQISSVTQSCLTLCEPMNYSTQASLSTTNSKSLLKLMSVELVMSSNHLILCFPLFLLSSIFPISGSFPMCQFFASGGPCIGVSASVIPMNIQGWLPLGLTGWISFKSKRLTRVFSNSTVQKHQFFSA